MLVKHLAFSLLLISAVSCSMMKSKKAVDLERTIASIEPNQLKVDEIDGNVFVSINFEVLGLHKGDNTFTIKLPSELSNDLKHDLPYNVFINSNDISCIKNYSIEELTPNYEYKVDGYFRVGGINCRYVGQEDKKLVSVTYIFHKLKHIPVEKANPYIQPVNQQAKDANRILKEVKKGKDINYVDDRLLFDVFAKKFPVTFDPRKHQYQFDLNLDKHDIIRLKEPTGEIYVPGVGDVDFKGKANKKFAKFSKAGKKHLAPKEVRPFELFCHVTESSGRSYIQTFQWSDKIDFYNAKRVRCGLNTKKLSKRKLKKVSGKISMQVDLVKYQELETKIVKYLDEPQKELNRFIDHLNERNLEKVSLSAQETINSQIKAIETESSFSETFPYSMEKEFLIKNVYIFSEPKEARVKHDTKIFYYVDLEVFGDFVVVDPETGVEYQLGRIPIGKLKTNKQTEANKSLKDYEIDSNQCGDSFSKVFAPYLKKITDKAEEEGKFVDYDEYSSFLKENRGYMCEGKNSASTSITLRRRYVKKCGDITFYKKLEGRNYVEKAQVTYNKVSAFYDAFENIHRDWRTSELNLFKLELPVKNSETIKTNKQVKELDGCSLITNDQALKLMN